MNIPQHIAAVHITHDVFNRRKCHIHLRRVVHCQHNSGDNLHHQAERQHNAPDPHPVQVFRRGDRQGAVQQTNNRQALIQPGLKTRLWFVMVMRNSGHDLYPYPSLIVDSSSNFAIGTGRLRGAGPLRIRPAVS